MTAFQVSCWLKFEFSRNVVDMKSSLFMMSEISHFKALVQLCVDFTGQSLSVTFLILWKNPELTAHVDFLMLITTMKFKMNFRYFFSSNTKSRKVQHPKLLHLLDSHTSWTSEHLFGILNAVVHFNFSDPLSSSDLETLFDFDVIRISTRWSFTRELSNIDDRFPLCFLSLYYNTILWEISHNLLMRDSLLTCTRITEKKIPTREIWMYATVWNEHPQRSRKKTEKKGRR